MDIKDANTNFSVEDLLDPNKKINKNNFKIDYLPMWKFLDGWERKVGGFQNVAMKDIFEGIYEYAIISVSLDKADSQTRIDFLTEQNIKWCTKATDLEAQVEQLKIKLQENQSTKLS